MLIINLPALMQLISLLSPVSGGVFLRRMFFYEENSILISAIRNILRFHYFFALLAYAKFSK